MKLSEAMMLGDMLRKRNAKHFVHEELDGTKCGCALGGASLAIGLQYSWDRRKAWPWILEEIRPGWIWESEIGCSHKRGFIAVMEGVLSFEDLCRWVEEVEPSCGECNRFDCSCVKSAALPVTEEVTV